MGAERRRAGTTACLLGTVALVVGACSTGTPDDTASDPPSATASGGGTGTAGAPTLDELQQDVLPAFETREFDEAQIDLPVGYGLYLPEDFDSSGTYPMVVYVSDSTDVGDEVAPPTTEYGALVWASEPQQAAEPTIVLVPQYPDLAIADVEDRAATDYVDLTAQLVRAVQEDYQVDKERTYATGQDEGALTVAQLAAREPDLFAGVLLVDPDGDSPEVGGIARQALVSVATDPDDDVQAAIRDELDRQQVTYGSGTWDAGWPLDRLTGAAEDLLATDDTAYLVTLEGDAPETPGGVDRAEDDEQDAEAQRVYEIAPLRDWLVSR